MDSACQTTLWKEDFIGETIITAARGAVDRAARKKQKYPYKNLTGPGRKVGSLKKQHIQGIKIAERLDSSTSIQVSHNFAADANTSSMFVASFLELSPSLQPSTNKRVLTSPIWNN